jgi:hypothetical protein
MPAARGRIVCFCFCCEVEEDVGDLDVELLVGVRASANGEEGVLASAVSVFLVPELLELVLEKPIIDMTSPHKPPLLLLLLLLLTAAVDVPDGFDEDEEEVDASVEPDPIVVDDGDKKVEVEEEEKEDVEEMDDLNLLQ